jgi:outer membrane protein assembly factor BamB
VLWVHEASEHFIASPVATEQALFVSALGTFNTAAFYSLSVDPAAAQRVQWKKGPPALRQAMVCAPAIVGDKLIFGDGMHQTDGATLRCLSLSGRPIWQLPVGGTLVHLEGAPTIANGRVYIGGGSAGILCVDMNVVTLDGNETDLATAQQAVEKKWGELQAAYEKDKQKDADFAIPPSDDSLPKPAPKLVWQVGQDKMHVDSALAVVGDNVLASSAGLDVEQVGDRALYCLDAATGLAHAAAAQPLGGPERGR